VPFPKPESGLVISYACLWRREAGSGQVEGRKIRPCAIVLAVQYDQKDRPKVAVAPITHSEPADLSAAVEIPAAVKRQLGLDSERSWIILDEFNIFGWPGFDLAPVPGSKDQYAYGHLPPGFFRSIIAKFAELRRGHRISSTVRDEI